MKLYDDHMRSLGVYPCPPVEDDGYSLKKFRLIDLKESHLICGDCKICNGIGGFHHFCPKRDEFFAASSRAWVVTEERIKALDRAARFILWADHAGHLKGDAASSDIEVFQVMLAEAGQ